MHTDRGAARARCCAAPRRGKRPVAHTESRLHEERDEEAARAAVAAAQRRLHWCTWLRTSAQLLLGDLLAVAAAAAALLCSPCVGA